MLRFLSKRFGRDRPRPTLPADADGNTIIATGSHSSKDTKNLINCKVLLLDGSDVSVYVHKKSLGGELYDALCEHINLAMETDYFGLQVRRRYMDI